MIGIAGAEANTPHAVAVTTCVVCDVPLPDGVGYAARAMAGRGVVQACSAACAASPRFSGALRTVRVRILVAVDADGDWYGIGTRGRDRSYCEQWIGPPEIDMPRRFSWIEVDAPMPEFEPETTIKGEVKEDEP